MATTLASFDTVAAAERAVLSAMLGDARAIADASQILSADDFEDRRHRRMFAAMVSIAESGTAVGPLTLVDELVHRGELDDAGGRKYVGDVVGFLAESVLLIESLEAHSNIVRESAQRRRLTRLLQESLELTSSGEYRPAEVAERISVALAGVRPARERFTLVDDTAVERMPPLQYLVDGMIPVNGLVAIYGPPESGKSFAALHLACCVATGEYWFGNRVTQTGPVVYIAAEGVSGLAQRLTAWKAHHGYAGKTVGVHFLLEAANLLETSDRMALLVAIGGLARRPALVIIDTLHRSMPGGDENSSKDVGLVIDNADRIKKETGATVMIVHHSRKDADVERGSSSLRGAVDTLLQAKPEDGALVLLCEKQKDLGHFSPISFSLLPLSGSCVVELLSTSACRPVSTITPQQRQTLKTLSTHFLTEGATATQLAKASGLPDASFYRVRTALVNSGYMSLRGKHYVLSDSGRAALTINSQPTLSKLSEGDQGSLSRLSHPVGVIGDESEGRLF